MASTRLECYGSPGCVRACVRAFVRSFVRACVQHTCVPRSKRPLRVTSLLRSFGRPAPRAERSHSPFRSAATRSNGTTTLDISRARIAVKPKISSLSLRSDPLTPSPRSVATSNPDQVVNWPTLRRLLARFENPFAISRKSFSPTIRRPTFFDSFFGTDRVSSILN